MEEQLKIDFEKKLKDFSYSDQEKKFKEINFKEFLKQGFPNRKLENWKFSDLNQIIKSNIGELTFYNDYKKENQIDKIELISELEHNRIIIVDGKIEKIDFKFEEKDKIEVLAEQGEETIKENINSLINLNNAFSNKFCKITVKKNYSLKKPLVIYHSTNKNTQSKNTNSRIDFTFFGKAAHAATAPHLGRSALDAIELMNVGVNYMREHIPDAASIMLIWILEAMQQM